MLVTHVFGIINSISVPYSQLIDRVLKLNVEHGMYVQFSRDYFNLTSSYILKRIQGRGVGSIILAVPSNVGSQLWINGHNLEQWLGRCFFPIILSI